MLKLFSSFGSSQAHTPPQAVAYSRMHTEEGRKELASRKPRLSRFEPVAPTAAQTRPAAQELPAEQRSMSQVTVAQQAPAPQPEPMVQPEQRKQPVAATTSQEPSSQIPLWVFRKALPQRFAAMTGVSDEFVFQ